MYMYLVRSFSLVILSLLPTSTSAQSGSSACPCNYPAFVNTTTGPSGFLLHVKSNNPLTRNRAVQLRPDATSDSIVVVDSTSPVLLSQMRNGVLYSENTTIANELYDLGPIGGLANVSTTANSSSQAFVMRKPKSNCSSESFQTNGGFQLIGLGDDGTYGLYHDTPDGYANGFVICEKHGGEYFQLFYYEYLQDPPERTGCEYVGLEVSRIPAPQA